MFSTRKCLRLPLRTFLIAVFACVLFSVAVSRSALAEGGAVVGVNVYDLGTTQESQDAVLKKMQENSVKTIRISNFGNTTDIIIRAYNLGISTDMIVYPHLGTKAKSRGGWAQFRLTECTPQEFTEAFKPILDKLEAAGVKLASLEFGNEINTSGYNGDIPDPGTGRTLGLADLKNPNDQEGRTIAASFKAYLQGLAALKELRDHSKLNGTTPILLAGLADWGLPAATSWSKQTGVSVADSIEFLQQNGLDKLVDGYGVHVYPSGDPNRSVALRIESLEKYGILSECKPGAKPCWVTEWGFRNPTQTCPVDDSTRKRVIEAQRSAFRHFVQQGRVAAIIYYTWSGPANKFDPMSIFRCGALSDAGKVAVSPL